MMSKICGHRGAARYKPENTISGFEWCVQNGIEWAECDVQLTIEEVLLVIHDDTLDRTSNTTGLVKEIRKKELETINVGKIDSKNYFFQKIPTMEELLRYCKNSKLKLNIEMKFYQPIKNSYRERLVSNLLQAIKKNNIKDQVLVTSFDLDSLLLLRKYSNQIPVGVLYESLPKNWEQNVRDLNATTIHLDHKSVTGDQIKQMSKRDIQTFVYTCNHPPEIDDLWRFGLSGVITDDPLKFK